MAFIEVDELGVQTVVVRRLSVPQSWPSPYESSKPSTRYFTT